MIIRENISLAPLTTLAVGGRARYFLVAEGEEHIVGGFEFAKAKQVPVFVLGGGSNVLISDKGFDGLVIHIALKGASIEADAVFARAGENWDRLVELCVENDLSGIEFLSGIPGTVGGTPVQNVGAYGQEVSETITSVRCYDRTSGEVADLSNEECGFSYRRSVFNTVERDRYVVLSVKFRLDKGGRPKAVYKDLAAVFGEREPTPKEARENVLRIRRSKSMVIDPDDPNRRSAGSFFKNPLMTLDRYNEIKTRYAEPVPFYPQDHSKVKVPAAWLIEHAGFYKGYVLGNAGISSNHTLAIINRGGATAADIVNLKDAIQKAVADEFCIDLIPEPVFLGEF